MDKEDGDIAYYHALSLYAEYLSKVITAGTISFIGDDADRHRYTIEHHLVRANAVGEWVGTLGNSLTGSAAQFFYPEAREAVRDLTERVGKGDWRYETVYKAHGVAELLGIEVGDIAHKVSLRQFFQINAAIRNKTRGHGAITSNQCGKICKAMEASLDLVSSELHIFSLPWAFLHRNLSGKYRVSPLWGDCSPFDYLKRTRDVRLVGGVYIYLNRPIHVPLIFTDPDLLDILVPNGQFRDGTFEILSYITNESQRAQGSIWLDPPNRLPTSETEGLPALEQTGNLFANLPPKLREYVPRHLLEDQLSHELLNTERHPIVSLTGPGGIGKTTLAISALEKLSHLDTPPYDVIVWISSRDIDLLESGPKPVSPSVVRQKDIAQAIVELVEPKERAESGFDPTKFFELSLREGAAGPTLFVIDNFETMESPSDVFRWIDTHIRLPNKVLITTRFRDFAGDYPISVSGMTDDEARSLIKQETTRLGIGSLVSSSYVDELIRESEGHPYVMKILLGQVANEQRAVKPERIVATADNLLRPYLKGRSTI